MENHGFGKALRIAREMLALDQIPLAEKAGRSQGTISLIETGRKGPDLDTAAMLVIALVNEALGRQLPGAEITSLARRHKLGIYEMTVKGLEGPLPIEGRRTLTKSNPFYSAKVDELAMLADFLEVAVDDILHGETGTILSQLAPR